MAESGWGLYRRGWRTAVVILAALGLLTAVVFVGWSTNVVAFLMGGTLVASVHLSIGLAQEKQPSELIRVVLQWAARAGACVVAIVGYATAIGMGTLWLLLLIVLTSPALVSRLWPQAAASGRRPEAAPKPPADLTPKNDLTPKIELPPKIERAKPKPERKPKPDRKPRPERKAKKVPTPEPPPPQEPVAPKAPEPVDVTDLSDDDLCLAWRRSFTELQSCTTDEQRLAVITARNAYLDELERRAPVAFAQWLDSGPRAAGNPSRFFSPRANHGDPD
ncbi:hypothetical protein EV652_107135 [Kribbella steppae]|uniref:Uncharacterized protein n=1 Tax=Kribbella steppae TaxID=2512223 RepID=A0A4R2HE00_9ACTN|nr:hypothetical protein [Kribbella steppae]TCO26244.1 hypothetical protein EV652_107135 [Kribbella steppae]